MFILDEYIKPPFHMMKVKEWLACEKYIKHKQQAIVDSSKRMPNMPYYVGSKLAFETIFKSWNIIS